MKICIISNLYPPFVRGGAELIAAMEAEGLKKAWQHVSVISTRPANIHVHGQMVWRTGLWTSTRDEVGDIEVIRFNPVNLYYYLDDFKFPSFIRLFWHLFDIFNVFSYWKIKNILLKEKPDVVITHNLMGIGFLIPLLIRKLKIRHIHTLHDIQLSSPSGLIVLGQEKAWQHRFFRAIGYVKIMRSLMGSPEIVISPSKFLLDFYSRDKFFPKSKKFVMPNPIKGLASVPKQASDNLELIYLGQIHRAKGVLELIKNFKQIAEPNIRLHIVGAGPELFRAQHLASEDKRIIFYGWLPHHELGKILPQMDIVVVPSLCYENSPTVIYESLSLGLPVLAADIGGTAELIKEGINGWVFPAGDFGILKDKIKGLYKEKGKVGLMADNCRRSVAAYNLDNYIKHILKIIGEAKDVE